MLALLEDALRCVEKYLRTDGRKGGWLYRDTDRWIFARDDGQFFSFASVCDLLEIDPEYLRKGIRQWKQKFAAGKNLGPPQAALLAARPRVYARRRSRVGQVSKIKGTYHATGRSDRRLSRPT